MAPARWSRFHRATRPTGTSSSALIQGGSCLGNIAPVFESPFPPHYVTCSCKIPNSHVHELFDRYPFVRFAGFANWSTGGRFYNFTTPEKKIMDALDVNRLRNYFVNFLSGLFGGAGLLLPNEHRTCEKYIFGVTHEKPDVRAHVSKLE